MLYQRWVYYQQSPVRLLSTPVVEQESVAEECKQHADECTRHAEAWFQQPAHLSNPTERRHSVCHAIAGRGTGGHHDTEAGHIRVLQQEPLQDRHGHPAL